MSLRQVTKRDSHFLVKYVCDKKLQVRGTGFFATSEKVCNFFLLYLAARYCWQQ
jgi:hypothetical protein